MNKTERVKNTYFLLYVVLLAYILIPFHFDAFREVGYTVPQFFPREVSERMFASFTCSSQGWSHSSLNSLSCRWTFKSNCSTFFFFFFQIIHLFKCLARSWVIALGPNIGKGNKFMDSKFNCYSSLCLMMNSFDAEGGEDETDLPSICGGYSVVNYLFKWHSQDWWFSKCRKVQATETKDTISDTESSFWKCECHRIHIVIFYWDPSSLSLSLSDTH